MTGLAQRTKDWLNWRRLLASCDYEPTKDADVEEMSNRDFIITGCPRSGTSLLTAQLFRPPEMVTCMEPWDGLRMPVAQLARDLRSEIKTGQLSQGRLDLHLLEAERRVGWIRDGERTFPVEVNSDFQLGIKWPAFWQYLPLLDKTRFLVCVRDPAEVVASFANTGGRLADGYDYDVAMNKEMNAWLRSRSADAGMRQALMWEYINSRILPHIDKPNVKVVRYERWFTEPDRLMHEVGEFLDVRIEGSNIDLRQPGYNQDPKIAGLVAEHCPTGPLLGYER